MASAFGHAFSAVVIGAGFNKSLINWKFWMLGMTCSILPDADVIAFKFGIAYESFWGHRGFSHSILFAVITGLFFCTVFYGRRMNAKDRLLLFTFFFLCTVSHGVLDALTSGGLGVAFFSPLENSRYFFPWRPIQVSPIGTGSFFTERGLKVVSSELIWIGLPGLILTVVTRFVKRLSRN